MFNTNKTAFSTKKQAQKLKQKNRAPKLLNIKSTDVKMTIVNVLFLVRFEQVLNVALIFL